MTALPAIRWVAARSGAGPDELAFAEAPHRPREPDGDRAIINLSDLGEFVLEVATPDPVVEHHHVTHAQLGDRLRGTDRVKQLSARVDRVGDRDEMLIKFPRRNRVEQLPLGILQSAILSLGPQHRLCAVVDLDAHASIFAVAADVSAGFGQAAPAGDRIAADVIQRHELRVTIQAASCASFAARSVIHLLSEQAGVASGPPV